MHASRRQTQPARATASGKTRRGGLRWLVLLLALLGMWGRGPVATACPFCRSVSQTFSDRLRAAAVVVRARLLEVPDPDAPANLVRTWPYRVQQVLKGKQHIRPGQRILAPRLQSPKPGTQVVILGADPPDIYWAVPVEISDRAWSYIEQLPSLPPEGPQRLRHFLPLLVDVDPFVAADAYDEFAKAPYEAVKGLRSWLDPAWLRQHIQHPQHSASLKRLLLLLLAQCGQEEDARWLEQLLAKRPWPGEQVRWLDSAIACYLTLSGPQGLPLVRKRFLQDPQVPFGEVYAAVLALRFHGQQEQIIPRPLLVQALHDVLDRPRLVDLVLPDLARWEDWSLVERLGRLFEQLGPQEQFVRPAIVRYMLVCPRPEARQLLARWEKQHPRLVRQARLLPAGAARGVARRPREKQPQEKPSEPDSQPTAEPDEAKPTEASAKQNQENPLPLVAPEPGASGSDTSPESESRPSGTTPGGEQPQLQSPEPEEITPEQRAVAVGTLLAWSVLLLLAYVWLLR